jgi:hypothetical protein
MDTSKIRILTLSGDYITLPEWQLKYGLEVGSTQIGKYFRFTELRFQEDIREYGFVVINEPLIIVLDEYRRLKGKQVVISSLNRNAAKQAKLVAEPHEIQNLRAIVSTHEFYIASDVDCVDEADVLASVPIMLQAAENKMVRIRLGWKAYLAQMHIEKKKWEALPEPKKPFSFPWTFMHVDTGPEYFAKGKPWHSVKHEEPWEREARW